MQVKLAERLRLATDSEKRFATFQQVWGVLLEVLLQLLLQVFLKVLPKECC